MWNAFFWGLIATSSLLLGGLIGSWFSLSKRVLGIIMAFGAGVLISAVAYEMVFEAVRIGKYSRVPGLGLFAGALTFFFSDWLIGRIGGRRRKDIGATHQSKLVVPIVLAIIVDGIPESAVIGLGLLDGGTASMAMVVAVFISNLPEAIAQRPG